MKGKSRLVFPVTLVILMSVVSLAGAASATDSAEKNLMAKCKVLSVINDLSLTEDQIKAMSEVASRVQSDHQKRFTDQKAMLEPYYSKLLSGEVIDMDAVMDELKEKRTQNKEDHKALRDQMQSDVERIWSMLTPQQQIAVLSMPMMERRMNIRIEHHGAGAMRCYDGECCPEGLDSMGMMMGGPGCPISEELESPTASAADSTTSISDQPMGEIMEMKAHKGKKGDKKKVNPGYVRLMEILRMPGAAEALSDRLSKM